MHSCITAWKDCSSLISVLSMHDTIYRNYTVFIMVCSTLVCSMCSISVQEMLFCTYSVPPFATHIRSEYEITNPLLYVVLLLSSTALQHVTLIVSFTCVSTDYAGCPKDWRQVENIFDRIRNCGESGGHTDSDAHT